MLEPQRVKWRKQQQGRIRGVARTGCNLSFGDWGLQATTHGRVTARQIEAARMAMSHATKRGGKLWVRIFPDRPITKKPLETRMGKGKGGPEYWVAVVKPGTVMFELAGVERATAAEAMRLAGSKLPIRTKFVARTDLEME